ncbi:adenosylcobinamide-phosphate synthase CbiB [Oscillatoria salina]|uniref:adenosylcobinamide-phosphate synthase CbiB n=1 Tax=Oscillatoria salina TaxID=331517 RepID=UPI0013B8D1B6|nr:adenosylcobinamide-phosphate synthase CbiB [Oscillatoria salina]MBZ8183032.1 cobalamin biosynthesis protein [Oscillatoria salina IIICB1]NET86607.1 cobalamin biosynthesis protein [Kamptonema sp. SIO1D9]
MNPDYITLNSLNYSLILVLAATLDYLVGDPWALPHPVQFMGWIISRYTQFVLQKFSSKLARRIAGIGLTIALIFGSAIAGWSIVRGAIWLHPIWGLLAQTILLASCFATRSLRAAAEDVLQPLITGNLTEARSKLSRYVGRDTENLDEGEVLRAVLETIAENTTDGVTAPLFYAIVGAFLPGIGSVPFALAYKAASTLDSMVGYTKEPYLDLGWSSAKLEDLLTWFPCRLTVLTIAWRSPKFFQVWKLCLRDAKADPSPNSGWSECAFAAALNVQLGGTNFYGGVLKYKPLLGEPKESITPAKIQQGLQLMRFCFLLWLGFALVIFLAESIWFPG